MARTRAMADAMAHLRVGSPSKRRGRSWSGLASGYRVQILVVAVCCAVLCSIAVSSQRGVVLSPQLLRQTSAPAVFTCSATQREKQQQHFARRLADHNWSSCPDDTVFNEASTVWEQTATPSTTLVLLDVGTNKGYTIAGWLGRLVPMMHEAPQVLAQSIKAKYGRLFCGVCQDCKAQVRPLKQQYAGSIEIHSFEPMPANSAFLVEQHAEVEGALGVMDISIEVNAVAMSNIVGTAPFPLQRFGTETASLGQESDTLVDVPTNTIDAYLAEKGIHHIDLLKIDTEGYDPLVLEGAAATLAANVVDLVQFEYHRIGKWSPTAEGSVSLEETVARMDHYGYDCYFDGRTTELLRLTGCWTPLYEIRKWSNVVCARRSFTALNERLMKHTVVLSSD